MGNGMNKILPGLFIGNFKDARDVEQLHKNNVTHILSIHDSARPMLEGMKYLCIPASDSPNQNLIQHFKESTAFIHECRLKGEGCLVHCLAGVSRSVTLVVAYVMTVTNLKWEEALSAVKGARTCANPNMGFQRQLEDFEKHDAHHMCCSLTTIIYCRRVCNSKSGVQKHREWLKETYGENPFPDEEEVKLLIAKHKQEEEQSAGSSSRQWSSHLTPLSSLAFRNYTTET